MGHYWHLRNDRNSNEYKKIFERETISLVVDTRLTDDKLTILNELVNKHNRDILAQNNAKSNMTARTLICLPKQFTQEKPCIIFDQSNYRYDFISLINKSGSKTIIGAVCMRPTLMQDGDMITKQFKKVEEEIDNILNSKG